MAITKRFVKFSKVTPANVTLAKGAPKSISFVGSDDDLVKVRDIITQGKSWVQDPLNEREMAISGLNNTANETGADVKNIATTPIATIGDVTEAQRNLTLPTGGITLNNLNEALKYLNQYVNNVADNVSDNMTVDLKKLASSDEGYSTNWAAQYRLTQGGSDVGQVINIPKDQFLKEAHFVTSSSDTSGYASTTLPTDITYPALQFVWQLDEDGIDETDANVQVTYVPVKDLVDIYTGSTVKQDAPAVSKIYASTVSGTTVTAVTGADHVAISERYQTTVSLVDATDSTSVNGEGKEILVTLNDNILADLAAGKVAEENAKVYADNLKKQTDYTLIGKGTDVFFSLGAESGSADAGTLERAESVTKTLGGEDLPNVASALNALGDAIDINANNILELQNAGAATKAIVDSLHVQNKGFGDPVNGVRNVTLYGDEITLDENAFAATENHELGFTYETTVTTAIKDLEAMWEWEEDPTA